MRISGKQIKPSIAGSGITYSNYKINVLLKSNSGLNISSDGLSLESIYATSSTYGSTTSIPVIEIDKYGRIISATSTTIYIPSISLTTIGNSGASTYINGVLNVPNYTLAGLGGISLNSLSATTPLQYDNISGVFSILQASSTQSGYLSSTDWSTFNNKQVAYTNLSTIGALANANGFLRQNGSGVFSYDTNTYYLASNPSNFIALSSLSVISPLQYNNTTGVFSVLQSSSTQSGYLSSSDWNTFNNKQVAYGNLTTFGSLPNQSGVLYNSGNGTFSYTTSPNLIGTNFTLIPNSALINDSITIQGITVSLGSSANIINGFGFVKASGTTILYDNSVYLTDINGITASGDLSGTYPNPTVLNSAVIGKVLTGLNVSGGAITASDTILSAFGKVQNQIDSLVGGQSYQGTWDASTNTPLITSGVGTKGYYYVVSVAGTTNIDGISDWKLGDWIIFDGTAWSKIDNTGSVTSVNGYVGAVVLVTDDISDATSTNKYFTNERARLSISSTATGLAYNNTTGVFSLATGYVIPTTIEQTNWNTAYTYRITSLTTTGNSGAATLISNVLNIPNYTLAGLGGISLTSLSATTPLLYNNTTGAFSILQSGSTQSGFLSSTDWNTFNNKQVAYVNLTAIGSLVNANGFLRQNGSGVFSYDTNTYYLASNPNNYIALTNLSSTATGLTYTNTTGVFSLTAGYVIPTTTSASNWDTAYSNRITSLTTTGSSGAATLISNVLNIPIYTLSALGGVPYVGATASVDLGTYSLYTKSLYLLDSTQSGYGNISLDNNVYSLNNSLGSPIFKAELNNYKFYNATYSATIKTQLLTSSQSYTLPNQSGTFALTSDIPVLVSYIRFSDAIPTGDLTGTYGNPSISNLAVTSKTLTGLTITGGTISSGDTILSAFGKVQNQLNNLVGGVSYQGVWDSSTNTPSIVSGVGSKGYYYVVSVAGSTNIDGITDWKVGDWIIFNGTTWNKIDNTDSVTSVNGFTGAVVLTTTNIAEGTNLYYTDARSRSAISLTTTGNSGSATYSTLTGVLNIPTYTLAGLGGISLTSLSATTPLQYNNTTGVFSIQQAGSTQSGFLSTTDWNTFNNKQVAYVNLTAIGALANANGFLRQNGSGVFSYDTNTYYLASNPSNYIALTNLSSTATGLTYTNTTGVFSLTTGYVIPTTTEQTNWNTAYTYRITSLTTTGSSGAATLISNVLNIPTYTLAGLGGISLTSLSATTPLQYNSITGTFSILQAGSTQSGYLSTTDWNTFNNKQVAYTNLTAIGSLANANGFLRQNGSGVFSYDTNTYYLASNPNNYIALTNLSSTATGLTYTNTTGVFSLTAGYSIPTTANQTNWDTAYTNRITSLTTTGNSGSATLISNVLNIPTYTLAGLGGISLTGLSATTPLLYNNTTGVFSIQQAGSTQSGFLSTTDWNTFSNKQNALSGIGFVKISGTTITYDNSVYLTANQLITLSGDISGSGTTNITTTIGVGKVTNAMLANSTISGIALGSNLADLTVSTGLQLSAGTTYNGSIAKSISIDSTVVTLTGVQTLTNKSIVATQLTGTLQAAQFPALTGEATTTSGSLSVTLSNTAVTGKVLTGLSIVGSAITASDTILSAFGKIQNQLNGLSGGVTYQGSWNASTNTPTITSSVGTKGHYYTVGVAGTTSINGINSWDVGDWIIFDGTSWQKIDNTDSVISVNGQIGAVVLTTTNISEGTNLYYTNARGISSTLTGYVSGSGVISASDTILVAIQKLNGNINALVTGVSSVFGRTGAVVAQSGDYTTAQVTESGNLYYTDSRSRSAISLTTSGSSGAASYTVGTGVLNIPNYTLAGLGGISLTSLSATTPLLYNNTTGVFSILQSGSTQSGFLSTTDWNTFNNKQVAYANLTAIGALANANGFLRQNGSGVFSYDTNTYYLASNPSNYIALTNLSSTATGLTYTNTTGVFSLTAGYVIPTTTSASNWDTAYTQTRQWDGGATGLVAATGRTSLGGTTVGQNIFTLTNPSAITFLRINVDNTVSALDAATFLSAIGGSSATRTLTINGSSQDLSANRTWTITTTGTANRITVTGGTGLTPTIDIASTYVGQTSITTLGTIGTGVWQGTAITDTYISSAATWNAKIGGSGTTNYVAKFSASGTIAISSIFDNGTSVGIGTTSPSNKLHVVNTTDSPALRIQSQVTSDSDGSFALQNYTDVAIFGSIIGIQRARGTIAAPTGVLTSDVLGGIYGKGYTSASTWSNNVATIRFLAAEGFGSTNHGTDIDFSTTPIGGTSVNRVVRMIITSAGNVGIGQTTSLSSMLNVGSSAQFQVSSTGRVGLGVVPNNNNYGFRNSLNITGLATAHGIFVDSIVQSDVTTSANGITSTIGTVAGVFTVTNLTQFLATEGTKGAGSTITNQYGFRVNSTFTNGTNNFGFYGDVANASGRWNFYANGTAPNYFAGNTSIGSTTLTSMFNVGTTAQFQVNSSGAIVAATGITSSGVINFSSLTPSQLIATDASKNLVSLDTTTYPSLTELSYVKGVTSSIQTQLNSKISLTALSATTPLQYNNTTGVFSIQQSGSTQSGFLSTTDWNTFNNKQVAYTNLTAIGALANANGFLRQNGSGVFSYDTNTYYLASNPNNYQTTTGTVANIASGTTTDLNAAWTVVSSSISNGFRVYRYDSIATNSPIVVDNANWVINIFSAASGGVASYGHQIAAANTENIYFRKVTNGGFGSWRTLLHSANYNSYAPTLTGGGASGTWSISITGDAGTLNSQAGTYYLSRANHTGTQTASTISDFTTVARGLFSVTNTGSSGAATYTSATGVFNIPNYTLAGLGGQPLDATLTALAAYNTNGILTQTAADTFVGRTITGTINRLTVTNGDGVSGNPTIDIASTYVGQTSITTLGTIGTGTWQGTAITDTYISSAATWNAKIGGSGTTNYVAMFTASGTIGNSPFITSSNNVAMGTASIVTYAGYNTLTLGGNTNGGILAVRHSSGFGGNLFGTLNGFVMAAIDATKSLIFQTADIDRVTINSSGVVTISNLTASQLIATDASKNLVSLDTATYPSLTELSYVKGVTSSIQTQLNSKISLTALSATTPLQYNNTTGVFSIQQSGSTQSGFLSSTDWNTFNNKQVAYANLTAIGSLVNANGFLRQNGSGVFSYDTNTYYLASNPNNYIALTNLSSTATGLTYTNTTGVFSLTAGYVIPTTTSASNWDTAYSNRITSLTTTGSSGAATLISNVLNIPTYTISGLGGQPLDSTLTALAAYNTNGILTQTATDTFVGRTITGTTDQVIVSNGDGVSGNPVLSLPQSIATTSSPTFQNLSINNSAATNRILSYKTAGVNRWDLNIDNVAEAGSNAGSNFNIIRYDDAGASLGTAISINRASGTVTIGASTSGYGLIINSGASGSLRWGNGAQGGLSWDTNKATIFGIGATNALVLGTNGTERIVIGATGGITYNTSQTITSSPTTSAGGYEILTRNTSTGAVEKIISTTYQPLDATLTALAAYNTNGILTQTAADTFVGRTITGTINRLTVTNGDGVSGNPTLDISSSYIGQSSITTVGTLVSGAVPASLVTAGTFGAGTYVFPSTLDLATVRIQAQVTTDVGGSFIVQNYTNAAAFGASIGVNRARGTIASPAQILSGDVIGGIYGRGYTSSGAWSANVAAIRIVAAQDFVTTQNGTYIDFATTPLGSPNREIRMIINSEGNVTIGSTTTTSLFNVGSSAQFQVSSAGNITTSGSVTLSAFTVNGGLLYTNGSGLLTQTTATATATTLAGFSSITSTSFVGTLTGSATSLTMTNVSNVVGGTDLNTVTSSIFVNYGATNYWTNTPLSSYGFAYTQKLNTSTAFQFYYDIRHLSTDYGDLYFRTLNNTTTWAGWAKIWHSLNDGASSGLDADLLDGQQGTYYLSRANHTGTQTASTISDFTTVARGLFSVTNTGSSGAATYTSATGVFNIPNYTLAGLGGVASSRTLTINGSAQDLSADRTWTITTTGTTNRITVTGGTGLTPTIDIASTYVGQTSITTLGTIGTGTWQGTAITDTYISSAATWNAKIGGSGTTNYVARFSATGTIAISSIFDNGTSVGIGTITPSGRLDVQTSFAASSGTTNTTLLNLAQTINNTGTYAGIARGLYYNPTLTSLTGTTHRAIETVSGDVILGSTSGSVTIGSTTTTSLFNVGSSAQFQVSSAGNITTSGSVTLSAFTVNGGLLYTNGSGLLTQTTATATATTLAGFSSITSTTFVGALSGNATTATALATGRTISITGDISYTSPAFDGSANVTAVGTLATVNSNVGTFGSSTAIPTFTVNAKGLITAASTNAVIAPAGTLTGTTLNATVVSSSLTSIGTLVSGAVPASLIIAGTFGAGAYVFPSTLTVTTSLTTPIIYGSSSASGTLTLSSTSNATKGKILFGNSSYDEVNDRLGIGVNSPTNALSFSNASNRTIWIENSGAGVVGRGLSIAAGSTITGTLDISGGSLTLQSGLGTGAASSTILFQTGTTLSSSTTLQSYSTKMVILGNGNVGIGSGNTTPAYQLTITGNVSGAYIPLLLQNANGGVNTSVTLGFSLNTSLTSPTPQAQLVALRTNRAVSGDTDLRFDTFSNGSLGTRMIIRDDGNISIGSSTFTSLFNVGSSAQFQVNSSGAIAAATGITSSGTITLSTFTTNGGLLYTNASGVVAQTSAGTSTQVLHGGTTPSYSAISLTADVSGILPIANGGTNNSTAYTTGSIIFSDGTKLTQDNANIFWDNTNKRLGIGTATPSISLHVSTASDAPAARFQTQVSSNSDGSFMIQNYSSTDIFGSIISIQRARGTIASPSAILSGDVLGGIYGKGYTSASAFSNNIGAIRMLAAENFTATNQGTDIDFSTTPIGGTSVNRVVRMTIASTGNIGIGTAAGTERLRVDYTSLGSGTITRFLGNGSSSVIHQFTNLNTAGNLTISLGEADTSATPFYIRRNGSTNATPNRVDIWNVNSGDIRIGTNDTARLTISSGGNVTIGSTTTTSMFNVGLAAQFQVNSSGVVVSGTWQGAAITDTYISSAATWNAKIGGSGTTNYVAKFSASGTIAISSIFDNGTNVGIGTAAPTSKFQVNQEGSGGTNTMSGTAKIFGSPQLFNTSQVEILNLSRPYNAGVSFGSYAAFSLGKYDTSVSRGARMSILLSNLSDTANVEVMSLLGNGNVTIGSTTATSMFNVGSAAQFQITSAGNLSTSGTITTSNLITSTTTLPISFQGNGNTGIYNQTALYVNTNNTSSVYDNGVLFDVGRLSNLIGAEGRRFSIGTRGNNFANWTLFPNGNTSQLGVVISNGMTALSSDLTYTATGLHLFNISTTTYAKVTNAGLYTDTISSLNSFDFFYISNSDASAKYTLGFIPGYDVTIDPSNLNHSRTYTLPDNDGTLALSVNGNMANSSGEITLAIPTVTPSALTRTNDTNVTITLGGTPTTALLSAVSLTVGWTGTLADGRIASAATWNAKLGTTNVGSGLTWNSGTSKVDLGGTLTANTTVTTGSNLYKIAAKDANNYLEYNGSTGDVTFTSNNSSGSFYQFFNTDTGTTSTNFFNVLNANNVGITFGVYGSNYTSGSAFDQTNNSTLYFYHPSSLGKGNIIFNNGLDFWYGTSSTNKSISISSSGVVSFEHPSRGVIVPRLSSDPTGATNGEIYYNTTTNKFKGYENGAWTNLI